MNSIEIRNLLRNHANLLSIYGAMASSYAILMLDDTIKCFLVASRKRRPRGAVHKTIYLALLPLLILPKFLERGAQLLYWILNIQHGLLLKLSRFSSGRWAWWTLNNLKSKTFRTIHLKQLSVCFPHVLGSISSSACDWQYLVAFA